MGEAPACTVVVMGYRNAPTIERAVRSVLAQRSDEPVEVVVVVSGDDAARSAAIVQNACGDLRVVAEPERLLPGAARNVGVAVASGEVIAFLAADCAAEPSWVTARLAAHRRGWDAVAGAITIGDRRHPAAWASHFDLYRNRLPTRPAGAVSGTDPAAHGLSLRRELLARLGPFDETLRIGEDTDMARRVAAAGIGVWFAPEVRTAHFGPRDTLALVRDHAARGARLARYDPRARPRTMRAALGLWQARTRSTVREAWRVAGPDRRWVIGSSPWVALANAALVCALRRAAPQ